MFKLNLFFTIMLCFGANIFFAQDVNLTVSELEERRFLSSSKNYIELTVEINGMVVNEQKQVKLNGITKAVDDLGNTLEVQNSYFGDKYEDDGKITIKLDAPLRKATKIAALEGTISYFEASEKMGSKIAVDNIMSKRNKNLLKGYSDAVTFTMIDQKELAKLKEKDKAEFDKKMQELKDEGVFGEVAAEVVDAFGGLIEGFANMGSSFVDADKSLTFYAVDKDNLIIDVMIYNGEGKKMNSGFSRMNSIHTFFLREKPQADWKIDILFENPKATKKLNFSLNNIILP